MKQILKQIRKEDRWEFFRIVVLNIAVALTSSVSIVMLIPMLELLDVSVGSGSAMQNLLRPFMALSYAQKTAAIIAVFVLLLLARAFLQKAATVRMNMYLEKYEMQMRKELYDAVGGASWQALSQKPYTDLINLFTVQCRQARTCLQMIISLLGSVVSAAMQLAIAFWMSLPVTVMILAVGGGFLALFNPILKRSKAYGKKGIDTLRALHREVQNQLYSVKEIRAYGVEQAHEDYFDNVSRECYDTSLKMTQLRVMPQFCYAAAAAVLVALAFAFSVLVMDTGTAELMVLVYVFSRLWPIFSSWQGLLQNIQSSLPAFEIVRTAIVELQNDEPEPEQKGGSLSFEHDVAFDKVCFTYKNSTNEVLHDVSFTLPRGSVTALVGRSGAGKSTTADLLLGLLRPTEGSIRVDGHALQPDEQRMWRKSIGYIPQEPLILNATVRENLSRFHPQATEEDMIDALKKSLAWPVLEKLPEGLNTVLGDKGMRLSGGERQRIVLARVLMGDPKLIILDEATSALDYESETFVRETIRELRGKATVLIIAHRLATIRGADRAIVLENGTIAEQGTMEDLLNRKDGYLWRMLRAE